MSKFYCSSCGAELIHTRKAVPGKGHIFDLIDPHECEGYAIKSPPDELSPKPPTVLDILSNLKSVGETKKIGKDDKQPVATHFPVGGGGDRRKDVISSTAPASLVQNIKGLPSEDPNDDSWKNWGKEEDEGNSEMEG